MSRPKPGTVLVYTGPYADEVAPEHRFGRGEVTRTYTAFGDVLVTVRLIDEKDELYADWPADLTAPA